MQDKRLHKSMPVSEYANSLITEMKSLSNALKPLSKNIYQNNNRLLNELLLAKEQEIYQMIIKILNHTLQIAQYKTLVSHLLSILNKTIICIKTFQNIELSPSNKQSFQLILNFTIDVLIAVNNQHSKNQQISLRVLQTAFSLIDHKLMQFFNFSMITRMFSICFQFCTIVSIVQNISVSALFSLVENLFQFGSIGVSFQLLKSLLLYLFENKKYIWIKAKEARGLTWDLVVICIKNFTANHIIGLEHQLQCKQLITKMYELLLDNIFLKKSKTFYNVLPPTPNGKNLPQKQQTSSIIDFIRFFKAFVALSTTLSIQSYKIVERQYVSFHTTIPKLGMVCDLQRNSRMYIFLEAICQLLLNQYDIPLSMDKGIVFMEILSKISQELCWCNQNGIQVHWEHHQNYLNKVVNQEPKINDGNFVKLIKNTIIHLRMKFQKDQDLIKNKLIKKESKQSQRSVNLPQNMGSYKKWQAFIKNVVRIIRYLSSLNYSVDQNEQDPTRKIILQLQYWFLICPISKAKNMVLQELLITSNVLSNRMQAIKVSQSVQIGTNILYGYYEDLDSMGLTIILKMMAGIKADWEEGKSFQELDQVYNLVINIYSQQKLIRNEGSFLMTIQASVQCASSLIADIQQPKQKPTTSQGPLHSSKRSYKMIQFLLQKLIVVVSNNLVEAAKQWNFITGFLITLCINKNPKIKQQGIKSIGTLVSKLLKTDLGPQIDSKKQLDILSLYQQLSKSKHQTKQFQISLIEQLKNVIPRIKQQGALMDGFRIVKILSDSQSKNIQIIGNIHQLQQIMIKQCLFQITQSKYLKLIVQGMQIKASGKNQEYRLISLLWAVSDYFRKITPQQNIPNQYIQLWESLFKTIWIICESSKQLQTKQSAIHTTTQILAEVINLLPFDFIIIIISRYYQQMVLLLLGIHHSSLPQSQKSSQTAKVALKNYIKIFKKLISIQIKTQENKKQIGRNFSIINRNITKFINNHIENKNTGNITLQLLLQILNFIAAVRQDKGFEEYGVKIDLRDMFNSIEDLIKICQENLQSGITNSKMDLKSHLYKKKFKPVLDKIRQAQDLQKKDQVIANNIENEQK